MSVVQQTNLLLVSLNATLHRPLHLLFPVTSCPKFGNAFGKTEIVPETWHHGKSLAQLIYPSAGLLHQDGFHRRASAFAHLQLEQVASCS